MLIVPICYLVWIFVRHLCLCGMPKHNLIFILTPMTEFQTSLWEMWIMAQDWVFRYLGKVKYVDNVLESFSFVQWLIIQISLLLIKNSLKLKNCIRTQLFVETMAVNLYKIGTTLVLKSKSKCGFFCSFLRYFIVFNYSS